MATITSRYSDDDVRAKAEQLGLVEPGGAIREHHRRTALRTLMAEHQQQQQEPEPETRDEPVRVVTTIMQGDRVLASHTIDLPTTTPEET